MGRLLNFADVCDNFGKICAASARPIIKSTLIEFINQGAPGSMSLLVVVCSLTEPYMCFVL